MRHLCYFIGLLIAEQLPLAGLSLASLFIKQGQNQLVLLIGSLFLSITILIAILFWQVYLKAVHDNHNEFQQPLHKADWLMIALGFGAMVVINLVTVPFIKTTGNGNVNSLLSLLQSFLFFMLFFIAFIGPVLEEVLFRGLFLNWFFTGHRNISMILSAFIFGTFHVDFTNGQIDPIYWLSKILLGFILVLVYNHTKNLKASILLHILNNTLAAFI